MSLSFLRIQGPNFHGYCYCFRHWDSINNEVTENGGR